MFRDLVEYVHQAIISLRPSKDAVYSDIYGRPVEHADEFFHPVKFRGIPVFDPDSILSHVNYQKQIDRLREVVDIGDHRKTPSGKLLFDELYIEVLRRFITYVHMVPASEDHHHAYTGGLLTHSIEASIEALRWSKELKCQITHMADQDAQIKPVLDYAAWLGCLLHDVGKIMRDVSVDAVEVIHPFTKMPIPLKNPIVSWYPQKESLTQWAKSNHISAYSVTWIRNRTHNRHNIDSAQILTPLLQGTYAMDYLLSSPIKQELFSELVRCLSGYTQHKGHLSDCIRMGDSVSTNRALQIQYDAIRGHRRISTATKLYQCISHARKTWEWNRPKAQGWVIGNEAYIRWSSAFDSILSASLDLNYGLPSDTRNILSIMEQNGFAHLFDPDAPNDRILKFTPGHFNNDQKQAIISGKQSVTWVDLVKMVTPHVIFGELPMPPSMAGIIFLPASKLFFSVNKDGDISPMRPLQQLEQVESAATTPAELPTHTEPEQPVINTKSEPAKKTETAKKSSTKKPKPDPITEGFKPSLPKPAQNSNELRQSLFDNSEHEQSLQLEDGPRDGAALHGPDDISETTPKEITIGESPMDGASVLQDSPVPSSVNIQDGILRINEANTGHTQSIKDQPSDKQSVMESSLIRIPKNIRVSSAFQAMLDCKVHFYKTKKDILFSAADVEAKLQRPLMEILQELKQFNELQTDPMKPSILTTYHKLGSENVKCIALTPQLVRLFMHLPEGQHPNHHQSITEKNTQNESSVTEKHTQLEASVTESRVTAEQPKKSNQEKQRKKREPKPVDTAKRSDETPSILATASTASALTSAELKGYITKEFCHRNNGSLYMDIELLAAKLATTVDDCFTHLKTLDALHVCPLEPTPVIVSIKKSKSVKRFVKLAQSYDELLPSRKAPVVDTSKPQEVQTQATETDCIDVSLRNFANSAGEKSLVHYLVSKNTQGLIEYLPDGNLVIDLGAITAVSYKPYNKLKIGDALIDHGATKKDGIFHISHKDLEPILLENI